ncbi:MAG: leucyl-tRNA synthetase [Thermoleophilaceae bacterium]|nr:leucyl-tRNA synthetase [Thermoleophilaceae bacterium]
MSTLRPTDLPPHRYTAALANEIEEKWLARWDEQQVYYAPNPKGDLHEPNADKASRPKYYALDMFPYPSGSGLHVGHPLGYIGTDIYARFKRMTGFNVLHTMGYDAFGLPAERYAVDTGQHPEVTTRENIENMRRQLHRLGLGHDPRRSIATTDVEYYRWTQWIFLQIFNSWYDDEQERARPIEELVAELESGRRPPPDGREWSSMTEDERDRLVDSYRLAYLDDVMVNWCPALGTVLANEEVTSDGRSVIGDYPVYRRPLRQWMMRITAYADRLIRDLEGLEWPESLKAMQRNWVGRSEGARLTFEVARPGGERLDVFTTRPDTLFGATFAVVAPEHPLLDGELPTEWPEGTPEKWRGPGAHAGPADAVTAYAAAAARASERQRQMETERTGVYTGVDAIHPLTGERVPILTADYVLMHYGSGAIMGVPAGDERDFQFARQMDLPIKVVVEPPDEWFAEHGLEPGAAIEQWPVAYTGHGTSTGAEGVLPTDGMHSRDAGRAIVDALAERGAGAPEISYKLRDWLFSRQRYWGEPFPIVFDDSGRPIALPESELPVVLPELEDYAPVVGDSDDAAPEPPLARASDWVETELDLGDGPKRYRRETNTMPQWAGSCWYYLRYLDPRNSERFVDAEVERYWMNPRGDALGGVDLYVGGVEHAVLHLLYARFWHKVLYDLGHVSTPEPFQRLFNQGYVVAAAYQDQRGVYVEAEAVEEREGGWFLGDEPLTRTMGKMGKSLKNGVTPDDVIASSGADALRLYEMFLGPLDQDRPWETQAITGIVRFLQRIWRAVVDEESGELRITEEPPSDELRRATHRAVAAMREDIESLRFNTAISALMELSHDIASGAEGAPREVAEMVVLALAPFAPHMSEELWERLGHGDSLVWEDYPQPDPALLVSDTVSVAVQVNGKLRGVVEVPAGADQETAEAAAREQERVAAALEGKTVRRVVYVPERLINFVAPG